MAPRCGYAVTLPGETTPLECSKKGAHFCEPRARRAESFFENVLVHTKGVWARKPFLLEDWQRDEIIRPLFGTVLWDEQLERYVRLYRIVWIEIARKNGKSELLAGIVLLLLVADDEEEAEIFGAAKDKDQASLVFQVVMRMVKLSPVLSKRLKIKENIRRIVDEKTGSYYQVIASDATGNLGENPHGIVFDEIIAQPNRDLWDALQTGYGTRSQPIMVAATTAGNDPNAFAAKEHEYMERVAADPSLAPNTLVFIRNTPKDADWRNEANWKHANPALGSYLQVRVLRDEAQQVEANPATESRFRQFRLNQWQNAVDRWIPGDVWLRGGMDLLSVLEAGCKNQLCWGGIDLASTQDVCALTWDFPQPDGTHRSLHRFWVPEARVKNLNERTGGSAAVWIKEGHLVVTDGNVTDYDVIRAQIDTDARAFKVQELLFDPWNAHDVASWCEKQGLGVGFMYQRYETLSPPTKEWERLIMQGRYRHGNNPVMTWMFNNIAIARDPNDNIKIDKKRSFEKVDGPVSAVMALSSAMDGRTQTVHKRAVFL